MSNFLGVDSSPDYQNHWILLLANLRIGIPFADYSANGDTELPCNWISENISICHLGRWIWTFSQSTVIESFEIN